MDEYENHPSQKPSLLLERIIKASSNPGDTVLDPFSGTFTTSATAQKLSRKSIGIELQEEYLEIGLRRLEIRTDQVVAFNEVKRTRIKNKNGQKYMAALDIQLGLYDGSV